jgi:fructose-1,6-bisphosphatase/inositol monophosphatase family enzyme
MTPRELADKTVEDIIIRRLKAENDFYGYQGEENINRKKISSISLGGYRW